MATERAIISGSPRPEGKVARLATALQDALQARYPQDTVNMLMVCDLRIQGCMGCNRCRLNGECCMYDDMNSVRRVLEVSNELYVVSPVYFAGPPAQFKALLDRLQPYYWHRVEGPARPAALVAVGDGGDPYGFDPLQTCTRSALVCAGFNLETVVPCVGMDVDEAASTMLHALMGN